MTIIQITAGAGKMYCGACFRDNALVLALRQMGHNVLMVPLYLPASFEDEDQTQNLPIFYGGVNVYLEQKFPLFKKAPRWLHQWLASPWLLRCIANTTVKTQPESLGPITISMLKGEEGNQARELEELIIWLKGEKPDLICLSNALLVGLARRLKNELKIPIVCSLQGEDYFLDSLPAPDREEAWKILTERAADIALFIAPSQYFGNLMQKRLSLRPDQLRMIHNGINLEGFSSKPAGPEAKEKSTIGFFARMCPEKGLDALVEAYILLRDRKRVQKINLRIGGYCSPVDQLFVDRLKERLKKSGYLEEVEFCPNLSRLEKQAFLQSLTVFSVPASYGEAFGLYIIEAMASGVPVVQPDQASFPELINATGGGMLYNTKDPKALALALEVLLLDPARLRHLGETGQKSVREMFSIKKMAEQVERAYSEARR